MRLDSVIWRLLAVVFALLSCSLAQAGEVAGKTVVIASGEVVGLYYPEAGAVCRLLDKDRARHGLHCLVDPTAGSVANIAALRSGDVQFAIVQSRTLSQAINATGVFAKEKPFSELRPLLSLHGEALVVVIAPNSKIKTPADLKGKRLNLGHPGNFQRSMAEALLKAEGIALTDLGAALEMDAAAQVKALCDNKIDAAFFTGLHPMPEVQEAMDVCGGQLLPLKDSAIDRLVKEDGAYARLTIQEDDYQGLKVKVPSFGPRAVLVATSTLSKEDGYEVVKAVFDNLKTLQGMHPLLARLDRHAMAREGLSGAPLHEGAQRYYGEAGLP